MDMRHITMVIRVTNSPCGADGDHVGGVLLQERPHPLRILAL